MIRMQNASFSYPGQKHPAVRNIDLKIEDHEFLAVMGRNGSGKSTFIHLLNGLVLPQQGRVLVDELNTSYPPDLVKIRNQVGMVFTIPDHQFVANMVVEDVAFGPENMGLKSQEIKNRVDAALKMVSMEEFKQHPPYLLSGGQKQKICIAGVLAMKPRYMVLDEPASMLDRAFAHDFMRIILHLNKEEGITIVMVSHRMEEVLQADRVAIMDQGEVKIVAKPRRFISDNKLLRELGIEPLEISYLIEQLNIAGGPKVNPGITEIKQLVDILCQ